MCVWAAQMNSVGLAREENNLDGWEGRPWGIWEELGEGNEWERKILCEILRKVMKVSF